ncbi:hypothetical protein B0T24DRAFT_692765 [Lasiosphaeria ovina]|uniref:Uncharacterized protein n=1 Tax=Lasiosphaeria ovina TaxID=92902 RepID=A0AAE0MYZ9_9PEZI|nr:hypothetical protein B0T24DRAFT_692765 [Lasiosphaeria ovina]
MRQQSASERSNTIPGHSGDELRAAQPPLTREGTQPALEREYWATQRRFGALLGRPGTSRTGSEAGATASPALSQAARATTTTSSGGTNMATAPATAAAMNRAAHTSWWAETEKMPLALRELWRERLQASEEGNSATARDDSADKETALDTDDKETSAEAGDEETDVEAADDKL